MILQSWLTQLCSMLPNVQSAVLFETQDVSETSTPSATWPNKHIDISSSSRVCSLQKAQVGPVIILGGIPNTPLSSKTQEPNSDTLVIAYPLNIDSLKWVVVLEINAKHSQQNVILQLLNWGEGWLGLLLKSSHSFSHKHTKADLSSTVASTNESNNLINNLQIVQSIIHCHSQHESYLTLVSELANIFNFNRVWLGELKDHKVHVKALSNTASFESRSKLVHCVETVMEDANNLSSGEVLDCNKEVVNEGQFKSESALKYLLSDNNNQTILSFPLQHNSEKVGVLLFESPINQSEENVQAITSLLGIITPILALKKQANLSFSQQFKRSLKRKISHISRGKIGQVPFALSCFLILIACSTIFHGEYRIAANATLEGRIQRAVVAPFDSYIKQAFIRAGENVKEGDVIAQLDDQDLNLERQRLLSQKEELDKEYRKELAALNQAKIRIIKTQIAQLDVQLNSLESKYKRTQLISPLSGIIVSGDLSRSIGSPVKQGQVLFEVAPLNDFRLALNVDERDISFLKVGQEGTLLLKADPSKPIEFRLEQVATVYQQGEGRIGYRAEASLTTDSVHLRPGMEGLAKVVVGERSYFWLGFHRTLDWLTLKLWSWMP